VPLVGRPTSSLGRPTGPAVHRNSRHHTGGREYVMKWIDPDYCDIRLGFEVTAYAYVR
jgi:coenzyme PQQ precursor peptide PqqA